MAKRSYFRSRKLESPDDRLNPEWWGVAIAAVAMVVAVASVLVAYLQYRSMQDSIAVSREIAERQLKFAKSEIDASAEDTQKALGLTAQLVRASNELVRSGKLQGRNTEKLAESSVDYVKISASSLQQAMVISKRQQRSYIDIDVTEGPYWLDTKDEAVLGITITNSGLTPAFDTKTQIKVATYPRSDEPSLEDVDWSDVPSPSRVSGRNDKRYVPLHDLTVSDVEKIRDEKYGVIVQLRFSYNDIFGETHRTEYCWDIQGDVFEYCAGSNEMP